MSAIVKDRPAVPQAGAPGRYTWQAITLHWLLALLIIGMLWLGFSLEDIPRNTPARAFYVNLHKSIGVLVLLLALLRLAWRARHKAPAPLAGTPRWQARAAGWSHGLLYLFTLVQALSGYLGSAFGKYGVKFFSLPVSQWGWESKPWLQPAARICQRGVAAGSGGAGWLARQASLSSVSSSTSTPKDLCRLT